MSAPSTAYRTYKTRRRKAGTPDVDIDLSIAIPIQNTTPPSGDDWGDGYFNSTDTEAQRIAKIKDIFKIDGWLAVAKGTATTPEMGFIGFCHSRTAGNGLYHNWDNNTSPFVARGSGVRVPTTVNASAELLNDAGLNRKGECTMLSILSGGSTAYTDSNITYRPRIGNVYGWAYFRSAFYANSNMAIQIQNPITTNWQDVSVMGNLDAKIAQTNKNNLSSDLILARCGTYNFRATINNPEGLKVSDAISEAIYRALATMKYNADYASYAYEGTTTRQIYYDTIEIVSVQGDVGLDATTFAKNDVVEMAAGDIADYGFYVLDNYWYEYIYWSTGGAPRVTRMGLCAKWNWPIEDPAFQFYPIFATNVQIQFEEATLTVTSSTKTLTHGTTDVATSIPSFPFATYDITLNCNIVRNDIPIYIYIKGANEEAYLVLSTSTGSNPTAIFSASGTCSSIGFLPLAGETYYVFITDTAL